MPHSYQVTTEPEFAISTQGWQATAAPKEPACIWSKTEWCTQAPIQKIILRIYRIDPLNDRMLKVNKAKILAEYAVNYYVVGRS